MSFRQYGGINYAARNNIVRNNYSNANNLSVMTKVGQPSSIINFESDISGNTIYGPYDFIGDVTITGTLGVTGATTLSSTLSMTGTLNTDRIINNVFYQFQDKNNLSTFVAQIYGNAGTLIFDNDVDGGSYSFAVNNSVGAQKIPLAFNALGLTISTDNPASATSSFTVVDSSTTNQLAVIPNVGAGLYNASTDAGNILLLGTSNAISTETIQLSTWSATNNYVKIRPTSVGMGAGSATSTATTSVECNGTTVRITPSITFPDNSVQTTAYTGASVTTTVYTSGTSITISSSVKRMDFVLIGGGGGGQSGGFLTGGSGGGACFYTYINYNYNGTASISIGGGGPGGNIGGGNGGNGGNTTLQINDGLTTIVTANGGSGGGTGGTGGGGSGGVSVVTGKTATNSTGVGNNVSQNYGKGGNGVTNSFSGQNGNGGVIIVTTYS